jgi:16S rRNA (cytosine1402-N4)-methyltransferase
MMMIMFHKPVMLKEAIDSLEIKGSGVYVDLTFGGGGHSKEILQRINDDGRLIAFDQDESAIKNKIDDSRVVLLKQNFIYLEQNLKYLKISKVDGILADLGVSSFQLDSIDRGFSFERDSNLDMRMNQKSSPDAIEILNNYSESDLANMFFNYSDLTNSRKIAKIIVEKRNRKKIKSSNNLNEILSIFINHGYENKFLARVYQAIRIEVNQEIKNLKKLLNQLPYLLNQNGLVSIITYHSVEDRLVKRFFKNNCFGNEPIKDDFGNKILSIKPKSNFIKPSELEIKSNPRARSAKLRTAVKI